MSPRQDVPLEEKGFYHSSATTGRRIFARLESETSSGDGENHNNDDEDNGSLFCQEYEQRSKELVENSGLAPSSSYCFPKIPPTISLPILVFIDMFAVSLVVPLLFQYYKNAGVTSANQRELLSSVFSSSQIVGGMVLGALADAQFLKRKTILFVSFGGSAVAYAMIAFGGFHALIVSRILVGLVKQTMTVTTSMLTKCTTEESRAQSMGLLQSSATASWIVGPSAGAILFKYVDPRAPALLACALFLLNMMLAAAWLTEDLDDDTPLTDDETSTTQPQTTAHKAKKQRKADFWMNLKECFSSQALASVITATLLFSWVNRATSYASMGSYYEDMYGMEPHHRGYIQSYQQVLGFIVQSVLIGPLLSFMGGEQKAVCWSALLLASATFLELHRSMVIFLVVLSPAISVSTTMMNVSLRSLLTRVAPKDSIFSVFAALDVLQNASAVTVPFYRTYLFRVLGGSSGDLHSSMEGDPDPISWVISSGLHWFVASFVMVYLLRPDKSSQLLSAQSVGQNKKKL